jgi:hypothetical protein
VLPWVVQNLREAVIQFLAGLDDAHPHQAIAAGQFVAGADDLIDRASRAKTPPRLGGWGSFAV